MRGNGVLPAIWSEAKRRRLPSVLVGYPAASWFCIEALPRILANLGGAPDAVARVESGVTILAVAAFPLVLTLTWMFQVVPHADAPDDAPRPRRLGVPPCFP